MAENRRPVIALVATPRFKREQKKEFAKFVYGHMFTLASLFQVISTENTYNDICSLIDLSYAEFVNSGLLKYINRDLKTKVTSEADVKRWAKTIHSRFRKRKKGVLGMIEVADELVRGKIDAVIQFSMEDDTTVRAGSAVLRREANVHDVPIASDIPTAHTFVKFWRGQMSRKSKARREGLFRSREDKTPPLTALKADGDRVLALIAHDGRKVEMSRFVMKYSNELKRFDHFLATGHSGELAMQSLLDAGWDKTDIEKRFLRFRSGPEGGDVQIAAAVIHRLCRNVVFFQDPGTSHPHEADIRLFEQAILEGTEVRLASNPASARILLET